MDDVASSGNPPSGSPPSGNPHSGDQHSGNRWEPGPPAEGGRVTVPDREPAPPSAPPHTAAPVERTPDRDRRQWLSTGRAGVAGAAAAVLVVVGGGGFALGRVTASDGTVPAFTDQDGRNVGRGADGLDGFDGQQGLVPPGQPGTDGQVPDDGGPSGDGEPSAGTDT